MSLTLTLSLKEKVKFHEKMVAECHKGSIGPRTDLFAHLHRDEGAEVGAKVDVICDVTGMSEDELVAELEAVFVEHDANESGVLEQNEFVRCMTTLGSKLGLDRRTAVELFQGVDVNGDGVVEWREFVGPAVHVILCNMSEGARQAAEAQAADEEAMARLRASVVKEMMNGMTQEGLEESLRVIFEAVDADGSGRVELEELRSGLRELGMTMSEPELNCMMYMTDVDQDGKLAVGEFVPVAFDMLVTIKMQMHVAAVAAEAQEGVAAAMRAEEEVRGRGEMLSAKG